MPLIPMYAPGRPLTWQERVQQEISRGVAKGVAGAGFDAVRWAGRKVFGKGNTKVANRTPKRAKRNANSLKRVVKRAKYGKGGRIGKAASALNSRLGKLEKENQKNSSIATWRGNAMKQVSCAANQSGLGDLGVCNKTVLEAALASLNMWDAASKAFTANEIASLSADTRLPYTIANTVYVTNNGQIPVEFECGLYKTTGAEANSITTNWAAAAADKGITTTDVRYSLFDAGKIHLKACVMKKRWRKLMPGQTVKLRYFANKGNFNKGYADEDGTAYGSAYGSHEWYFHVRGVPGHDSTTTTTISRCAGAIDVLSETEIKIRYESGVRGHRVLTFGSALTAVTTGLVSSKPVADNIAFALT